MDEDIYFHKTVSYNAFGHALRFRTSQQLFSSHDIDIGSRFLLRTIVDAGLEKSRAILDLGCGYGPLGLVIKKLNPEADVYLVDRDALAVTYARQNAELNGLDVPDIYGSLGYDDVTRDDFSLILSNVPGKAGEKLIASLLLEAAYYLAPDGVVAIVVVSPLEDMVADILENAPGVEIVYHRKRSGHSVFHYRFENSGEKPLETGLEPGVYHRQEVNITTDNISYSIKTAYGLPEFDSLDYKTEMLLRILDSLDLPADIGKAVVFNPGQGHIPVALWKKIEPRKLLLVDRDLLALRYSLANLVDNRCPNERADISHRVGIKLEPGDAVDLIIGVLREEEGRQANLQHILNAATGLSQHGTMVIAAGSTAITRLVADLGKRSILRILKKEKRKGNGLLVLQPVKM